MTYAEFLAARQLVSEIHVGSDVRALQRQEQTAEEATKAILRERGMVG